jgi:hypothetical protein
MKSDRVYLMNPNKKKIHMVLIERGNQKKLREEINKFFYWKKPNYVFGGAIIIVLSIYFYCILEKLVQIILKI